MFIARQPIFNKAMKVYGYELLFRENSKTKEFGGVSSTSATAAVVGGLFEQGIQTIVQNAKAFINFDYDFIMSDTIELIDPRTLVIEVLENIQVDEHLIERLKYLRRKGYRIALDDFAERFEAYPIVPIADIIKYDIMATPFDMIENDVKQARLMNKIILAEKIETKEEFIRAASMGFQLFQGYFFSKPSIIGKGSTKKNSKLQYMRMLRELKKEEPSYESLAEIIESDVNLAYRVMKIISNKPEIGSFISLRNALVRMGLTDLERWINVLMLQDLSYEKPIELMKLSLVRSRFGKFIAEHSKFKGQKEEISLMCLFSMLDAILDQPIQKALEGIVIPEDIYFALVYGEGNFRPILRLVLAYEAGDWSDVDMLSKIVKIPTDTLYKGYIESIEWTSSLLEMFV